MEKKNQLQVYYQDWGFGKLPFALPLRESLWSEWSGHVAPSALAALRAHLAEVRTRTTCGSRHSALCRESRSELAVARAAACALSDRDGLLITMTVISSERVSQCCSSLPPCAKASAGICRDRELSQLTEGCTRRPGASVGRAMGMHSPEAKGEGAASPSWQQELLDHLLLGCGLSKRKASLAVRWPHSFYMRWDPFFKGRLGDRSAGRKAGESSDLLQAAPLLHGSLQKLHFSSSRNFGLVCGFF